MTTSSIISLITIILYLCFVVLDECGSEIDRKISERVINNHMFTIDAPNILNDNEDKVIEEENKEKISNV